MKILIIEDEQSSADRLQRMLEGEHEIVGVCASNAEVKAFFADTNHFDDIMDFCFSHDANIRIDTHRDNRIMQHNIGKHGFTYCGIIYLVNGDERLAFQKLRCPTAFHTSK